MDDKLKKFNEKLVELLEYAKKKNNILEQNEIYTFFPMTEYTSAQLDNIYAYLEKKGIDIVYPIIENSFNNDDDDFENPQDDYENLDLSIPDGLSTNDPVRMYLKEIGNIPLLSGTEEMEIAQQISDGNEHAKKKLAEANLRLVVSIA